MSNLSLIVVLLVLLALGYQLGMTRSRKVATVNSDLRMHSRPHHYGMMVGLWAVLPAFFILLLWLWLSPAVINAMMVAQLPPEVTALSDDQLRVVSQRISNLASNFGVVADAETWELNAAEHLRQLKANSAIVLTALMAVIAAIGMLLSLLKITPRLKARHQVERVVKA